MNRSKHTVTIPVEDYLALMETKKLEGIHQISKEHPLHIAIMDALSNDHSYRSRGGTLDDFLNAKQYDHKIYAQQH